MNVLIVDDHELVRAGMRLLLEADSEVSSIVEATSGEEALKLAADIAFNVVLMDIDLPGMNGIETCDKLLALLPQSRIIVVTGKLEADHIRRLLRMGVLGYVSKGSNAEEMKKAVTSVKAGHQYLSADAAQLYAIGMLNSPEQSPFDTLTKRENEVINYLLNGRSNTEISGALHISEKTVSTHRSRAFEKLNIKSTVELVRLAMQHGLCN